MQVHSLWYAAAGASALSFSLAAPGSHAQERVIDQYACQQVSPAAVEPFEGRVLQVFDYTCQAQSGPRRGAVMSGVQAYEFRGEKGSLLVGSGVIRLAGGALVFQVLDGHTVLKIVDGKPVGAAGSGKGITKAAYGAVLAPLAGKPFSYSVRSTGPVSFAIDVTHE